jgi:protein tyrosine phosphatase (PTP) superfamily phosphohydrolase (DUF442 family)
MQRTLLLIVATGYSLLWTGCAQPQPAATVAQAEGEWSPERVEKEHLPNAFRLHERVISGGQPEGDAGFRELSELGVKTVISVDGARPDVELAKRHGLRYVHLPHGYDGVPAERARELAKAVRDLPGPVYIHCHHGKHRSPAAATVACVGAGLLPAEDALAVLQTAGTSRNYRGLYESAERAQQFEAELLDALQAELPESVQPPPMAAAMVEIEHAHDHLLAIEQSGWRTPADHPDLDPPHEALLLREHFTELLRTDAAQQQPAEFQEMLRQGERDAAELEAGLRAQAADQEPSPQLAASLARITSNCKSCHRKYRDVPLSEKR